MTFRCADASEDRGEPLFGTASFVRHWMFVEQPGAWGPDALTQSGLLSELGTALRSRARATRTRVVLIRRGRHFSPEGRVCYLATTTTETTRLVRFSVTDARDLLDVDFAGFAAGYPIEGAVERNEPLVVVCTHGRHDACCSIRGNRVARVACALSDVDAWECSHIGGDRFAANVVCFPHGIYYGRVNPDDVEEVIHDYTQGRIQLLHYRGRAGLPFPVQAAEYFLRRERDLDRIDSVRLVTRDASKGSVTCLFEAEGENLRVEVAVDRSGPPELLTCNAEAPQGIPRYELRSINRA